MSSAKFPYFSELTSFATSGWRVGTLWCGAWNSTGCSLLKCWLS